MQAEVVDLVGKKRNRVATLVQWLEANNPYPTAMQREMLAEKAGMSVDQVKDWFVNTRRTLRKLSPMKQSKWLLKHGPRNATPEYMSIGQNSSEFSVAGSQLVQ